MGRWDDAETVLKHQLNSNDPYIIYEECKVLLHKAELHETTGAASEAMRTLELVNRRITSTKYQNNYQLCELLAEVRSRQAKSVAALFNT
jgi:hypothetical protein